MIRRILTTILVVVCTTSAYSLGKLDGWSEQGGNSVSVAGFSSSTKVQKSFVSSTITVYETGTSTLATLYSDSSLTAKANPFTADSSGYWSFYAEDGCYDIRFSGTSSGISTPFTRTNLCTPGWGASVSDIRSFGAVCNGTTDDTAAVVRANTATLSLLFPADLTCNVLNWEPLAGTKIFATGSTIQRHADTDFGSTGSSAALVVTANNIEIIGGTWKDKSGITASSYSGSILLNGGDNLSIHDAIFSSPQWGGVFGSLAQNGSAVSLGVRIENCLFDGLSHNSYIADVEEFVYVGNESKNSLRDGLKLYRNVTDVTIVGNNIHDNGNNDPTESQDAIDGFISCRKCTISNNDLHDNDYRGIDLKIAYDTSDGVPAAAYTTQTGEVIISNNRIHNHGNYGISIVQSTALTRVPYVTLTGNQISGSTLAGLDLRSLDGALIANNTIYNNSQTGLQIRSSRRVLIQSNVVINNGKSLSGGSDQVGIYLVSAVYSTLVTGNIVAAIGAPDTWQASTSYTIGDIVYPTTVNGFLYRCITAGTSAASEPTWPVTTPGAVTSGTATFSLIRTWSAGITVAANDVIEPTVPNGYQYVAGGSGTTGGTEPTWPTTSTVADNGITWTTLAATQTQGIIVAGGECYNNFSIGHGTSDYGISGSSTAIRGKVLEAEFLNGTNTQLLGLVRRGYVMYVETLTDVDATVDVTLAKRNSVTGANVASIAVNTGLVHTAFAVKNNPITGNDASRKMAENTLVVVLANITGAFTKGVVRVHYID